jgi:hypothetical protein
MYLLRAISGVDSCKLDNKHAARLFAPLLTLSSHIVLYTSYMKKNKGRSLCLKNKPNFTYVTETIPKQYAVISVGLMLVLEMWNCFVNVRGNTHIQMP